MTELLLLSPSTKFSRLLATDKEVRIPASFDEFLVLSEQHEDKLEYHDKHIISMSYPSDQHKLIAGNIIFLLNLIFQDDESFRVYSSNLGTYFEQGEAYYKPDAVVLSEAPIIVERKVGKRAYKFVVNPFAVVEIASEGTMSYDLTEKLPIFKACPTLRHIIIVHQHQSYVSVYSRSSQPDVWTHQDCNDINGSVELEGKKFALKKVYRNVLFLGKGVKNGKL